jgi:cell division protein FtsL
MMAFIALVISIIALILAYKAYTNSGGNVDELRSKIHELGLSTEKIRQMTADALGKVEKTVRGKDHPPTDDGESSDNTQQ